MPKLARDQWPTEISAAQLIRQTVVEPDHTIEQEVPLAALEDHLADPNVPDEVVDIVCEIAAGCSPSLIPIFNRLRSRVYTYPGVTIDENLGSYRYRTRSEALKACHEHLDVALGILAQERQRKDSRGCLVDLQVITDRRYMLLQKLSEQLRDMNMSWAPDKVAKLVEQSRELMSDILRGAGGEVTNVVKNQLEQHEHLHLHGDGSPGSTYSAWTGGQNDLQLIQEQPVMTETIEAEVVRYYEPGQEMCPVCGELLYDTPSGKVCSNGHGF